MPPIERRASLGWTIPAEDQAILKAIGGWLQINGEAIYETTYWKTFGEGPTAVSTGHISESKDEPFVAEDLRFTARGDVLYVTGLKWPKNNQVTVTTLSNDSKLYTDEISSVTLLGSDQKLEWTRGKTGLNVQLPKTHPSEFAYVLKVTKQ